MENLKKVLNVLCFTDGIFGKSFQENLVANLISKNGDPAVLHLHREEFAGL